MAHLLRARALARARGYEAKTDPLDAQVLSRYDVVFSESDTAQTDSEPEREELRQLLGRRKQLMDDRVRELNRLDKRPSASAEKSTRRHVRWLEKGIERLNDEYKELLKRNANLSETVELYQTVPGVGHLTATTLVAYLPELARWEGRALTALAGFGLLPSRKTAGRSVATGQFEAGVVRCDERCTSAHGW